MAGNGEAHSKSEPIVVTAELQPLSSSQLSLGNRASSATSALFSCTVKVTVSDLRRGYFIDGRDGQTKHDGVVVVLEFEFGSQSRRSWNPLNRLSLVKIDVSVVEEDPIPGSTTSTHADKSTQEQELRILERYPLSAKSHGHQKSVKSTISASLDPSVMSFSGGSLSASRETITTQTRQVSLSSHARGDMCVVWRLEEEGGSAGERGVPDTFVAAVLLQTDGLPFSLDVRLDAPVLGSAYRAKARVPIGARALWDRKTRDGWEREREWSDFDSDAFKDWVKVKTRNGWAATAKYSADDTW